MTTIPKRLDKYLADAVSLSRSEIEEAWEAGRIDVESDVGPWADDYALWSLIFDDDVVRLDGAPVASREPSHYVVLHKPAGILSTTNNPQGRPCLALCTRDRLRPYDAAD